MTLIIVYNINFAIFNLIPLPPLDGSRILMVFLPTQWQYKLASIERFSFFILIALMATPIFSLILIPMQHIIWNFFAFLISPFL